MNKNEINDTVEAIIIDLIECEDGTVTSTSELAQQYDFKDDLFVLHTALCKAARANKIKLDFSEYEGQLAGLPYDIPFTVRNQKAQIKCPRCGSTDTERYIYGLPAYNEKMQKMLEKGKWTLGGCLVTGVEVNGKYVNTKPSRHCNSCHKDFGTPPLLITKKKNMVEDYRDIVESIKFEVGGYLPGDTVTIQKNENGAKFDIIKFMGLPKGGQISKEKWNKILDTLYDKMYLHEWKKKYVDSLVDDGEEWHLDIHLTNNRVRHYYGSNDYPPYWKELEKLFKL